MTYYFKISQFKMFALFSYVYNYLSGNTVDTKLEEDEDFLNQQLIRLEIEKNVDSIDHEGDQEIQKTEESECFERTGTVTYMDSNYGLIDGSLYFHMDCTGVPLQLNDRVRYLVYRNSTEDTFRVLKIMETLGIMWEDEVEQCDEKGFKSKEHVIIGQVDYRNKREVMLKGSDVKFDLDHVQSTIVPVRGDWLELLCQIKWDDESPYDVQSMQVLEVVHVRPLRKRVANAKVTQWSGDDGICDNQIYFQGQACQNGLVPLVGTKVLVEMIESEQKACNWRAITLIPAEIHAENNNQNVASDEEELSYHVEEEKKLNVTRTLAFNNVKYTEKQSINLKIINNSCNRYTLIRWKLLCSRYDSQLVIEPFINKKVHIYPNKTFKFTLTCQPKVMGSSREILVLIFEGFQIKRWVNMNIVADQVDAALALASGDNYSKKSKEDILNAMRLVQKRRQSGHSSISGGKPIRSPNFVSVKLGVFPIPNKLWSAVLGDSNETIHSSDFSKILNRIECAAPTLSATLNNVNYADRWHALLYIEEIQQNMSMRMYDMPRAFLTPRQGYLTLEIQGLSEKRPSLMRGDQVIVKDIWDSNVPDFEGYIHEIKGDTIFMQFNSQFHDRYSGYDVALEFQFSRSVLRKSHQAVNLALTRLGPDVLFPSRIITKHLQVDNTILDNMTWYNAGLNKGQKEAVKNILSGICRPMPYCIFGPPGTGKTITVVETILQILNLIPDSRILVATPSNSSANLLTERLLTYKEYISGSLVRLIAHYLVDSDLLPDHLKPYCATLDIARENTAKSNYKRNDEGINLSCRSTFVGRHRVTIGTCACLGTLAQMGLPNGHFTHVIVDEAGQATEPEIMIPLTFIEKLTGQIILAGDPLQLGPVVLSKYGVEFGLDQSYLVRILERVPYQKDYESFNESGFDNRLITRLTYNYRSVSEVIAIFSDLFYDGCLVPQLSGREKWIVDLLDDIGEILPRKESSECKGGIFMYGVKGVNARAADSPSWFNPHEAIMVLLYTCKLYKRNVHPDKIGIITPYIAQIKYLRKIFESTGTPQPKIGSVEEFQGQEKHIILLSTVRSSDTLLEEDYKFALGFVKSPKRLNVALSRAQVAVILFGDPHLLSRDNLWCRVISHIVNKGQYTGCDLPTSLSKRDIEE